MAKKRAAGSKINTEGWMMSYADMATILLAMFIVLSTLGKDQTGANLQKGLESWRESRQFFGLNGLSPKSNLPGQLHSPGPRYNLHPDETDPADKSGASLDAEAERLQRFLDRMSRHFDTAKLSRAVGQATLDFFDPLQARAPYLTPRHLEIMDQILPLLGRKEYRIVLVVWASMPSESALERAAGQAFAITQEMTAVVSPGENPRAALVSMGQPWRFPNHQRPVFSIIITRVEDQNR